LQDLAAWSRTPALPRFDGRLSRTDECAEIFLAQPQVEAPLADVIADGPQFVWIAEIRDLRPKVYGVKRKAA